MSNDCKTATWGFLYTDDVKTLIRGKRAIMATLPAIFVGNNMLAWLTTKAANSSVGYKWSKANTCGESITQEWWTFPQQNKST